MLCFFPSDGGQGHTIGRNHSRYKKINFSLLKYLRRISYTSYGRNVVFIVLQQSRQQVYNAAVVFEQQYMFH